MGRLACASVDILPPSHARFRRGPSPARVRAAAFIGVILGMTGYYATFTVAPLITEDLTGERTWSGLPGAAVIAGTAGGAVLLSEIMRRRGRRPGLTAGWWVGAVGALGAVAAVVVGSVGWFVLALLVVGLGHAANQLARFAAADAQPVGRQATTLSLVVWAGTIGAVAGPAVVRPANRVATALVLPGLSGGLLVAVVTFVMAGALCLALMRPDPGAVGTARSTSPTPSPRTPATTRGQPRDRTTLVAVAALVSAQFVMLLVMTSTPIHVRAHDHGLAGVGLTISLHVFGMFGFAPVAGWLCDRVGPLRVALVGLTLVAASSAGAAAAPPGRLDAVALALFGLGLGWSAAFVASSALLAVTDVRFQGRADGLGWAVAAGASLLSGLLLAWVGYGWLSAIGAGAAIVAAGVVLAEIRREVSGSEEPASRS